MTKIVWKIFFHFLSLLTDSIVKNSQFLTRIYFIFFRNVTDETSKVFNTKSEHQWKDWKSSYQARKIFALPCKLVALIFS